MTVRAWIAALVCFLAALAAAPAGAQSYPTRLIRIVVPFPPGGPTDVAARLIVQPLSEALGQSVIIENQNGAGGRTGSRYVARAAPDGYTLLLGGTNLNAIIPALYKNLDYDPVKSFVPVASIASDGMVMVVNPSITATTLAEFVAQAKAHPGKLKYGSAPGIASHLASELLKYRAGIDVPFIPYRGGAPAITDLLGGQIDMLFNNKAVLLALIQDRKLRPLAVVADKRWPELPDVPTMAEAGFSGFPTDIVYGLLAPAGTPDTAVATLNAAVSKAMQSQAFRTGLAKLGIEARSLTAQAFAAKLADDTAKYDEIVTLTGIKVE
ncbi:MAG TPA: tripartite tricarboxylate transporter substrate binding protein [Xanthobacteraceae bacterium]|nr:tripartite tricarboxylate transporter substrate binding protein [Xanthobacteraceae bacterium]